MAFKDKELVLKHLNERAKELNCLYEVDNITNQYELPLDNIIKQIIEVIPKGWRFSDKCKVEVFCLNYHLFSDGFFKTELKQSANIIIDSEKIGHVNIYYAKTVKSEKGIFLQEEQRLLNAVAEKLSNFIRYQRLSEIVASKEVKTKGKVSQLGLEEWLREFHLTEDEIKQVCNVPIIFKKGETIGKQGAITSYFLLLAEGITKSYLETPNKSYNFMITRPYNFIGLSSLFGNNYYFSTTALTNSVVYLVDKQLFIQLLAKNPSFNLAIMKWYCNSYNIIFQKLNCIANKQAIGRMSDTLLYLCNQVFYCNKIPKSITRKDIAALAGISTENAVRILSDFKNDGILSIDSQYIEVNKIDILKTYSFAG